MNNNEKKEVMKELEGIQYMLEVGLRNFEYDKIEWSLNKLQALTSEMKKELKNGQ